MSLLNTNEKFFTNDNLVTRTQVDSALTGRLATSQSFSVATSDGCRPERNPYRVYLARPGHGFRPTMAEALERIARIASGGTLEAEAFP